MSRVTEKTLSLSSASAESTGWVVTNTRVPNVRISYAVEKAGDGEAPVFRVQGTFTDVLGTSVAAPESIYTVASVVATSAAGVAIVGAVDPRPAAIRLSTISGGSGASTLTFKVLQTGY